MEAEGLLEQLRMSYATMYEATRKDLKSLTADREHFHMMSARQGCPKRLMCKGDPPALIVRLHRVCATD